MRIPRDASRLRIAAAMLLCLFLFTGVGSTAIHAQQSSASLAGDTAQGIKLYQQGDTGGAIKILSKIVQKRKDDADAWYYLGLALNSQGDIGASRLPFEVVTRLRPDSADAHAKLSLALILNNEPATAMRVAQRALELGDQSAEVHYVMGEAQLRQDAPAKALEEAETALRIKPDLPAALILKSFAQLDLGQNREAAESLERLLTISPNNSDAGTWREQIESLRRAAKPADQNEPVAKPTVFKPSETTRKARILTRPEPQYTEEARKAGVQGTVVLRAVFASDGTLKNMRVKRALGYGLTTRAIQAARRINFEPAVIDGRPVSQYIQIEYNFNLY